MAQQGIIGTAGHIDHGKSTLVQALTGVNPDRFLEEQQRGMTIDLGFARLPERPNEPEVSFVDVPGHEKFIRNMLAGAGGIQIALLVVAADSGTMPQTREHIELLCALGIEHMLVAITRIDLIDPELLPLVEEDIQASLAETPFAGAKMLPVSAITGQGMDQLRAALVDAVIALPDPNPLLPAWLAIDRTFTRQGVGTIITGSITQGGISAGDTLTLLPQNIPARVKSIERHGKQTQTAAAGHRVAINIHLADKASIERGCVLAQNGASQPASNVGVNITVHPSIGMLKHQQRIHLHTGTATLHARLHLLRGDTAEPTDNPHPAQLLLETPFAFLRGQKIAIRLWSPENIAGSATILHPNMPHKAKRRDTVTLDTFTMQGNTTTAALAAHILTRHAAFTTAQLASELSVTADDLDDALEDAISEGLAALVSDDLVVSPVAAKRLMDTAARHLTDFHRKNPLKRGTGRDSLRIPLQKAADVPDYPAVLTWLAMRGVLEIHGPIIHLKDYVPELPAAWETPAAEIEAVFIAAGYQPPHPNAFVYPRQIPIGAILMYLVDQERLITLGDDIYIAKATYDSAVAAIKGLANHPDGITVGNVRDATGSSRKVVLPLLERLDGLGMTRRYGDFREWVGQRG